MHKCLTGWPKERPHWSKRTEVKDGSNNYRPITCLLMMWKLFTAQIREEICHLLTSRGLFPGEQKGCCKGSRGTATASIVYRKAYDMVPHCWIINYLKMYKISHEVINLSKKPWKNWRVELTAGGKSLTETKIQRGFFKEMHYHR